MLSLELFKLLFRIINITTTCNLHHLNSNIKTQFMKKPMLNMFKERYFIQLNKKLRLLIILESLLKLESTQILITQLSTKYHMKSLMNILLTNLTMSHMKSELKTWYQPLMKSKQLTHNHTTSKSQLINLIMSKDSYQFQLKESSKSMFLTELMLINHITLKSQLKLITQFLIKLIFQQLLIESSQFLMKSTLKFWQINHIQLKNKLLLTDQFLTLSEKKSKLKSLIQLKKSLMLSITLKLWQKYQLMILNRMKSWFQLKSKFHNLIPFMKKLRSHNLTLFMKEKMSQLKSEFQFHMLSIKMLKFQYQSKSKSQFKEKSEYLMITLSKDKLKDHIQFQKELKFKSKYHTLNMLIDLTMSKLKFQYQEQSIKMFTLISKDQLKLFNKLKDKYLLLLLMNKVQLMPDHNTLNFKDPFLNLLL